ncbi:MAG TPA: radical SAM protein, partial [Bacteroidetes bacterium]|nr:radical SAM protein [Bacteroidota bacterium]
GYFYIDWDGNIAPCVFFPYYVDNIYKIYERGGTLSDALESPFFKAIRKWQDAYGYRRPASEVKNYFLPCPIRDHYKFAYRAIERFETKPLDEFAKQAIGDMEYRKRLLDYDKRLKELLDPVWEREVLEYEKSKKAARAA